MTKVTPRCVIVRHGQTEWSKSGQYTGLTDIPLTQYGVEQMKRTGKLVFKNKFIEPSHVTYVITSPRRRARQTVNLMLESLSEDVKDKIKVIVDEDLREWEYGDYEGLLTHEIVSLRKARGLDQERPWNIWRDGCENGETTKQVGARLSRVIARIQSLHRQHQTEGRHSDILIFSHGHALRYFAALWNKHGLEEDYDEKFDAPQATYKEETIPYVKLVKYRYLVENPFFLLDAGGIGVLSYSHHNIDEPALALAGAFIAPEEEESQHEAV